MEYAVRHAIAWSNSDINHQVRVCLRADQNEAEQGVRLEFLEIYGVEPDGFEAWPILASMIS